MRSKEELGQLLLDNKDCFTDGLCGWITILMINGKIRSVESNLFV